MHNLLRITLGIALLLPGALEATAVFEAPRQFRKAGSAQQWDLSPQASSFIAFGKLAYQRAAADAATMRTAIIAMLDDPSKSTLAKAQQAWRDARPAYQRTEMLRFFNSPIDHPAGPDIAAGPEPRINAWPLNEAVIDYVRGMPRSGLVFALDTPITRQQILDMDQASDESDITTGWHAIEFLLWGQDHNPAGPGLRPASDYLPGDPVRERRREYLRLLTDLLVEDLQQLQRAWDTEHEDSYGAWLSTQPAVEVLGRGLHGAASLAAIEIYGERMTVALDSRTQEDEHSCFSDNSLADLRGNLQGIEYFLHGRYGEEALGASVQDIIDFADPKLGQRLRAAIERAHADMAAVPEPFDQLLLAADNEPERRSAEKAAESARQLAVVLKAVAERLGIDIVVPGV